MKFAIEFLVILVLCGICSSTLTTNGKFIRKSGRDAIGPNNKQPRQESQLSLQKTADFGKRSVKKELKERVRKGKKYTRNSSSEKQEIHSIIKRETDERTNNKQHEELKHLNQIDNTNSHLLQSNKFKSYQNNKISKKFSEKKKSIKQKMKHIKLKETFIKDPSTVSLKHDPPYVKMGKTAEKRRIFKKLRRLKKVRLIQVNACVIYLIMLK